MSGVGVCVAAWVVAPRAGKKPQRSTTISAPASALTGLCRRRRILIAIPTFRRARAHARSYGARAPRGPADNQAPARLRWRCGTGEDSAVRAGPGAALPEPATRFDERGIQPGVNVHATTPPLERREWPRPTSRARPR